MSFQRGLCLALPLLFASGVAELNAQGAFDPQDTPPVAMIGYVVNAPDQLLGGGAAFLPRGLGGWGIYANAKRGIRSPSTDDWYRTDITPDEARGFGDIEMDDKSMWTSVNVALVRAFGDNLAVYAGGGASRQEVFYEFFDNSRDRAEYGYYWIPDTEAEGWHANVMGGMFFRIMRHVAVQIGAESQPRGFTVGLLATF